MAERDQAVFQYGDTNYALGVQTVPDSRLLKPGALAYGQNGYPTRSGRYRYRNAAVEAVGDTQTPRAVRRFIEEDGATSWLLSWGADTFFSIAENGVVSAFMGGLAPGTAIAHCEYAGDIYFSDGVNGLYRATPSAGTLSIALMTDAYSFTYLAARQDSERIFGIDAADETSLRWCDLGAPQTWNALSVYSPGGKFIACGELGAAFLAVTDDLLYRIDGTDPTTWVPSAVESFGLGCQAAQTFLIVEGVYVWWSQAGLVYFDGTRPRVLSDVVYDPADSARSMFNQTPSTWTRFFAFATGDLIHVYYPSSTGDCDRAMVYDFKMQAWGGPYIYADEMTCGCVNQRASGTAALPHFGASGHILRESTTAFSDSGGDYTMLVKTRDIDGSRPLMDKVFTDARLGYAVTSPPAGGAPLTLRMVCEDETTARPKASKDLLLPAGTDSVRKRVENARAKYAHIEVESVPGCALELFAHSGDCFFVRDR